MKKHEWLASVSMASDNGDDDNDSRLYCNSVCFIDHLIDTLYVVYLEATDCFSAVEAIGCLEIHDMDLRDQNYRYRAASCVSLVSCAVRCTFYWHCPLIWELCGG